MGSLIVLLIHILIYCLLFGLLFWGLNAVLASFPATTPPNPFIPIVRAILILILVLVAVSFLLGELGAWDLPWSYRHHLP